jgi:hypothetical protein
VTALFDPPSHEQVTSTEWEEAVVRAAIAAIVAEAEEHFNGETWPVHPADETYSGTDVYATHGLWVGAAGMLWALDALDRAGAVSLERDYRDVPARVYAGYLAGAGGESPAVPGLWMGESGILLVAELLEPNAGRAALLLDCVERNADNETLELMWGAPGTMLAAHTMLARTGAPEWEAAWLASAERLLVAWDETTNLWTQDLYGKEWEFLGPAHGLSGNVAALMLGGDLLTGERREQVVTRATKVALRWVVSEDGLANWPGVADMASLDERGPIRVQWCHGSPGMVFALGLLPASPELDAVLLEGGELTWRAGPLQKGPGLCHGTAGNGFAFLTLYRRTRDRVWLERARGFAMHALEQVERGRATNGRGRFSLWTGDIGAALFAWQCIAGDASFPTIDWW